MSQNPKSDPYPSQPVLWWRLINDLEGLSAKHHMGFPEIWGLVHRGNYELARERVNAYLRFRERVNRDDQPNEMNIRTKGI